jgi:hypothetical protein
LSFRCRRRNRCRRTMLRYLLPTKVMNELQSRGVINLSKKNRSAPPYIILTQMKRTRFLNMLVRVHHAALSTALRAQRPPFSTRLLPPLRLQIALCNHGLLSEDIQKPRKVRCDEEGRELYRGYRRYTRNEHARRRRGHPHYFRQYESVRAGKGEKFTHQWSKKPLFCFELSISNTTLAGSPLIPPNVIYLISQYKWIILLDSYQRLDDLMRQRTKIYPSLFQ